MYAKKNPQLTVDVRFSENFAQVIEALNATKGNVTDAAKKLNIGKRTLCRWIEDYPQLQRAVDKARKEV